MKKKYLMVSLLIVLVVGQARNCIAFTMPRSQETAIGIGVHYHVALSQLEETDFDDNYLSYIAGLKFRLNNPLTIDAAVEYYPSEGDISHILSPRLCVLYGRGLYFGTGIEWKYVKLESGESNWDHETYLVQAGYELALGGSNALSIDAYYGLEELSDIPDIISDFDSDHLTFGLRFYHYF